MFVLHPISGANTVPSGTRANVSCDAVSRWTANKSKVESAAKSDVPKGVMLGNGVNVAAQSGREDAVEMHDMAGGEGVKSDEIGAGKESTQEPAAVTENAVKVGV